MRTVILTALALAAVAGGTAADEHLDAASINRATYDAAAFAEGQHAAVAKAQVLLDRADASPGVIDGYAGENVAKAVRAFERMAGLPVDGRMDRAVWDRLQDDRPVLVGYTLTEEDVSDLTERIPEDYARMARMDRLGYTSVAERIAERFHMDVEFLRSLNPRADFSRPGTALTVADPGSRLQTAVARIEADKALAQLRAYDAAGDLVAAYPVTIGSRQTPSPSGTHEVVGIAIEPTYRYKPDENFQQGDNDEPLTLPPGPNGPVGLVWIDLSKPTYGLHGSPDPAEIDKEQSHGCVRMTNWDARELAERVSTGVTVAFLER